MLSTASSDPYGPALLGRVCRRALVDLAVDAIGVSMLIGRANLTPAYATDERAERLEHETTVLGEGPNIDAVSTHARVVVPDVRADEVARTWPMWTRAAVAVGFGAVAAFPIQQGAVVAGTLALYSVAPQRFDADLRTKAFRLADTALIVLVDIAAGVVGDTAVAGSPADQVLRPQVHRAAGMVMVQAGVSIDEAMVLLRAWSFRHEVPLGEVADQVVGRTLRFDPGGSASQ